MGGILSSLLGGAEAPFIPLTFSYTGTVQTWVVPAFGSYKIEAYGAAGGGGSNFDNTGAPYYGGAGGYSSGIITLSGGQTLYIVVGALGLSNYTGSARSFNGGGAPGNTSYPAGQGGGATHVAINQGLELYATLSSNVIIVAGGGGGGGNCSIGGDGGGTTGIQPASWTQFYSRIAGGGGTQSSGGTSGGEYGRGGSGWGQNLAGGGGGGWYGGGGGDNSTGGGGGSGYLNTSLLTNTSMSSGLNLNNGYVIITKP